MLYLLRVLAPKRREPSPHPPSILATDTDAAALDKFFSLCFSLVFFLRGFTYQKIGDEGNFLFPAISPGLF